MSLMLYALTVSAMDAGWPQWKFLLYFALCYALSLWSSLMTLWSLTHDFQPIVMVWTSSLAMLIPLTILGAAGWISDLRTTALAKAASVRERASWRQTSPEALEVYRVLLARFDDSHPGLREFTEDPEFMRRYHASSAYR